MKNIVTGMWQFVLDVCRTGLIKWDVESSGDYFLLTRQAGAIGVSHVTRASEWEESDIAVAPPMLSWTRGDLRAREIRIGTVGIRRSLLQAAMDRGLMRTWTKDQLSTLILDVTGEVAAKGLKKDLMHQLVKAVYPDANEEEAEDVMEKNQWEP